MRKHFCLLLSLVASGQVVFRSDTRLVNILATVHDNQGRVVRGLTKDDFRLEEDGQPREIHDFAAQSDLPLTLALLVDTSRSMSPVLEYEQKASVVFLKDALRPGQDRAAVFHFDSEVEMLCGLEGPGRALDRAVHSIRPTPSPRTVSLAPHRTTALYDAIVEASRQLQPVAGRKAIIVLTDGLDARSSHSLDEAVESALHSDTAVYTVLVPSPILPGLKHPLTRANALRFQAMFQHKDELNLATGRTVLGKISAQTGGDEFEATPARPVNFIYQAITDELRNQYRAGLSCGAENCRPGYHALLLTTRTSGQTVQSRQGFYSGGE